MLVDGVPVATENFGVNGNYAFSWDSTSRSDGDYQLRARAYDEAGNMGQSSTVTVSVLNNPIDDTLPPNVVISSPNGGTYARSVTVSAYATDDQSVTRIDVRGDGKLLCSGTSNASCTWNLRKLSDGTHTVTATAFDAAGNSGSSSVSFTKGSTSTDSGSNTKPNKGRSKK